MSWGLIGHQACHLLRSWRRLFRIKFKRSVQKPLGALPMNAPGKYCLIHPLSYPCSQLINDTIPRDLCAVKYMSFYQAMRVVHRCGIDAQCVKCNIRLAFWLVHPHYFEPLGFSFEGCLYMDRALPIGFSISCTTFEKFSVFFFFVLVFFCRHCMMAWVFPAHFILWMTFVSRHTGYEIICFPPF